MVQDMCSISNGVLVNKKQIKSSEKIIYLSSLFKSCSREVYFHYRYVKILLIYDKILLMRMEKYFDGVCIQFLKAAVRRCSKKRILKNFSNFPLQLYWKGSRADVSLRILRYF